MRRFKVTDCLAVDALISVGYKGHPTENGYIRNVGTKGNRFHAFTKAQNFIELHYDKALRNGRHSSAPKTGITAHEVSIILREKQRADNCDVCFPN